ncbi:PqqD family protein, partial [bacterium]|nr:PqqD family protein [bacterium]
MVKYVMPRMKQPHFKVSLDEFGSHIWEQIDGKRTIGEIGENLQEAFGEKVEPVWNRLTKFFVQLNN